MKNKLLATAILVFTMAVIFKIGIVLGQTAGGTITEVCKTPGGILMIKDNCPNGSQIVQIGEGNGGIISSNGVLFIDTRTTGQDDGVYAVKNDGTVWFMDGSVNNPNLSWVKLDGWDLPKEAVREGLVYWKRNAFITRTGQVYVRESGWDINQWTKTANLL